MPTFVAKSEWRQAGFCTFLNNCASRFIAFLAHYVLLDVGASRCFYVSVSQDGLDGRRIFTKFVILWQVRDEIHANQTNIVP